MNNPKDELRKHLEKLGNRYLNVESTHQQLKSIFEWTTSDKIETLNQGAHFFHIATYSMLHTVLVELSMLLSENEKRSLLNWLNRVKQHAGSMKPTRYNTTYSETEREIINPKEYRTIIDDQIAQLLARKDVIDKIKARRDKAIVHLDKKYFDNPKLLDEDYQLGNNDIDDLLKVVGIILRKQYSYLFEADFRMEVRSVYNVNKILQYTRAFMRVRKDSVLIKKGLEPAKYLRDDYEKSP